MVADHIGRFRPPAPLTTSPETVRRQAEDMNNRRYVVEVLDALTEFAALLNSDRQIILANRALLELLGVQREMFAPGDLPGEALGCVTCAEGGQRCGFNAPCRQCGALATMMGVLELGRPVEGDCRLTRRVDGRRSSLDLRVRATPFEADGEMYILLVAHDQSDQKRRRSLERVFFHDLLNTAGGMRGLAQLLKEQPERETALLADALHEACEAIINEITSHRDLARAEADELHPVLKTVDPLELLRSMAAARAGRDRSSGVVLEMDLTGTAGRVTTDPVLLGRVLGNMISNAVEASRPGQSVTIGCRTTGDSVEFTVHNQSAIPDDVQVQIFQRSFSTKGAGRGLGTYSMRLLGEQYLGGRVWFTSGPQEGTTFFARFPVAPAAGSGQGF